MARWKQDLRYLELTRWLESYFKTNAHVQTELIAKLMKGGAYNVTFLSVDSHKRTIFDELPLSQSSHLQDFLKDNLEAKTKSLDISLHYVIKQNQDEAQVSLNTGDEIAELKMRKQKEEILNSLSAKPYGSAFAWQIVGALNKGVRIFYQYDPRDGDSQSFYKDEANQVIWALTNEAMGGLKPLKTFESEKPFAQWLAKQSDRTMYEIGCTLTQERISKFTITL